jgi:hypothetical protein
MLLWKIKLIVSMLRLEIIKSFSHSKLHLQLIIYLLIFLLVSFRLYDLRQTGFIEREEVFSPVLSSVIFFVVLTFGTHDFLHCHCQS